MTYFFNESLISINNASVEEGPAGAASAGFFILLIPLIIKKSTIAMHKKLIIEEMKFP